MGRLILVLGMSTALAAAFDPVAGHERLTRIIALGLFLAFLTWYIELIANGGQDNG